MKKKTIALLLALALVFGGAVGGTIAWLTATSDTVTNTFTVGDINITLSETGATNNAKTYTTVPGSKYAKDPKVTVKAGSEACWLFVKITEENNTMKVNGKDEKIVSYTIATGWAEVTGHAGYYYRTVDATTADTSYNVFAGEGEGNLKNGFVTINENVAKGQITTENQPKIIITAAAVQSENVADVNAAWDKLPDSFTGTAD